MCLQACLLLFFCRWHFNLCVLLCTLVYQQLKDCSKCHHLDSSGVAKQTDVSFSLTKTKCISFSCLEEMYMPTIKPKCIPFQDCSEINFLGLKFANIWHLFDKHLKEINLNTQWFWMKSKRNKSSVISRVLTGLIYFDS